MSKYTIIGTGAWASGLANVLLKNNHKVLMWGIDQQEVNDINNGFNSKYFVNSQFNNVKNLSATLDLNLALKDFDYLLLAIPSAAISSVVKQIQEVIKDKKINLINVAKGIDSKTKLFFSEVLTKEFGKNINYYCSLIGPSFASEVFDNNLTMINIVGPNKKYLQTISKDFNNDTFRLVVNENEHGSELFAALKNVLAIGVGMIRHFHPYKNPQAALLSIGVKEIHQVYKKMYPNLSDNIGFELAGIGDIFLTCSSEKSRNFSFGLQVAQYGFKKAMKLNKKTIEGYHAAGILQDILKKYSDLDTPFLQSVIDVLYNNKNEKKLLDFINYY